MKKDDKEDPLSLPNLVNENEPVDPLTLHNLINAHSMIRTGYNWGTFIPQDQISTDEIYDTANVEANHVDTYKQTKEIPVQEDQQIDAAREFNKEDPRIRSTEPQFNVCPAFMGNGTGICRVSGKPCLYSNLDYKKCGLYEIAKSGNPDFAFQIPFGRENEPEYQVGIKA